MERPLPFRLQDRTLGLLSPRRTRRGSNDEVLSMCDGRVCSERPLTDAFAAPAAPEASMEGSAHVESSSAAQPACPADPWLQPAAAAAAAAAAAEEARQAEEMFAQALAWQEERRNKRRAYKKRRRAIKREARQANRINRLMMISPFRARALNLANRAWMAIFEHLRTSTVITRILYFGDFMNAWLSCRLVCREFLVAVNSIWIEVCRLFAEPALPLTPAVHLFPAWV